MCHLVLSASTAIGFAHLHLLIFTFTNRPQSSSGSRTTYHNEEMLHDAALDNTVGFFSRLCGPAADVVRSADRRRHRMKQQIRARISAP
ncbi:hypothetical protein DPEC_G00008570 [Dallia pectoralis]|uniref:Uncharacterized protein n=1 Tax=Dallia pectoralis TaxID=75939 RepID=A0ACC2HLJ8_DALPE|nr:hypothetical protein DPEC_G00008570 [Dallia pectoralis]